MLGIGGSDLRVVTPRTYVKAGANNLWHLVVEENPWGAGVASRCGRIISGVYRVLTTSSEIDPPPIGETCARCVPRR